MVYVEKQMQEKKERTIFRGKLISISSKETGVVDQDKGLFNFIDMALVEVDDKGNSVWRNVRYYGNENKPINLNNASLQEVKQADDLLRQKVKPFVEVVFYTTDAVVKDEKGNKRIFENRKGSVTDLSKFRIIRRNSEEAKVTEETV